METTVDLDAKFCSFGWNIENLSRWNWLKDQQGIKSPVFVADALGKTKWTLWLCKEKDEMEDEETFIGIHLHREKDCEGPNEILVNYVMQFLGKNRVLKSTNTEKPIQRNYWKGLTSGIEFFVEHEEVFVSERLRYLPEDTLNVRCILWPAGSSREYAEQTEFDHRFGTTVIEVQRRCLLWKIENNFYNVKRYQFGDSFAGFNLRFYSLSKMTATFYHRDQNVEYASLNFSIIGPEGIKITLFSYKHFFNYSARHETQNNNLNQSLSLDNLEENGVLTFHLEFVSLTFEQKDFEEYSAMLENEVVVEKHLSTNLLICDLRRLFYQDITLKDIELHAKTKIFKAHNAILSARCNTFREIFSTKKHESIPEYEDDTVEEMLLYIYTGLWKDLNYERAWKLRAISSYYQIPLLKNICFSFLKNNLRPTNAWKILRLARQYKDNDLEVAVENYILRYQKPIFLSHEWNEFMKDHPDIAADIMYRTYTNSVS